MRPLSCRLPRPAVRLVGSFLLAGIAAATSPALIAAQGAASTLSQTDEPSEIDQFMERVLERRQQNWITLHSYILDERETLRLVGPDGAVRQGFTREYAWYVRDGYLIRSPVRFDGVEINEAERRAFEADWLEQEQRRVVRPRRPPRRRSRRGSYENVMLTIEREWGAPVSEALGRRVAADAERREDDFAAVVAGTDAVVQELGGVANVGFRLTVERTRDAFVLLETERLTEAEVVEIVSGMISRLSRGLRVDKLDAREADLARFVELGQLAARFNLTAPEMVAALEEAETALEEQGWAPSAARLAVARQSLAGESGSGAPDDGEPDDDSTAETAVPNDLQPRFVSEAFFLDFPFEPGHYYVAGRDAIDGREVVVIEYYPEQLFSEPGATVGSDDPEDRIEAGFDRTSLVTLWVDPEVFQIVRFTFDNVGFDFLPGRWLLRLDDLTASMTMSQPFEGIWLPDTIDLRGEVSLAVGTFAVTYERQFLNYRQADVQARIRSYRVIEPDAR